MAYDLHLNAEGKLDFWNIRKRIEKKNGREKKKTGNRLHITCRLMHPPFPIHLFPILCFHWFYTEKIMFGYDPYPIRAGC